MRTREKLAYFAKNKWRGLFIYEDAMAAKIQKFYRAVTMKWLWLSAKREKHKKELAGLYKRWKRHQYDLTLRAECIIMAGHKFTPATHNMKKLPERFESEHRASLVLQVSGSVNNLVAPRLFLIQVDVFLVLLASLFAARRKSMARQGNHPRPHGEEEDREGEDSERQGVDDPDGGEEVQREEGGESA